MVDSSRQALPIWYRHYQFMVKTFVDNPLLQTYQISRLTYIPVPPQDPITKLNFIGTLVKNLESLQSNDSFAFRPTFMFTTRNPSVHNDKQTVCTLVLKFLKFKFFWTLGITVYPKTLSHTFIFRIITETWLL